MPSRISHATCSLCDATCGIEVEHDGDRILRIVGDARDPFSRGHVCPKVVGLQHIHDDPDRLRTPMKRGRDGAFHPIGWDDALNEAADRLAAVRRAHGPDSVGLYIGNATAYSWTALLSLPLLLAALGTKSAFSANSIDSLPRLLTAQLVYGSPLLLPVPDLDRTSLLVVLGANPAVSNGSMMTAPGVRGRLRAIRARGGRIVVVDPRRTETAAMADVHHFITPGTDALLLAAIARTLFEDGVAPRAELAAFTDGLDAVRTATAPFSPERVAAKVGIAAADIRALARDLATAKSAVIHGRVGTCTQELGAVTSWLTDVVHVLTGNLDRAGGAMFPEGPVDAAGLLSRAGLTGHFGRWRSRVRGLPEFNGELPTAVLAEEMDTPGAGQVRALVVHAGNPVLSAPNGPRVDAALAGLDAMIAFDIYVNETTRHAHLILPPTFGLQHDHFPLLFHGVAVRNFAKYTDAVLPKPQGARHDWEAITDLAVRLIARRGVVGRITAPIVRAAVRALPPLRLLSLLLRFGPRGAHGVSLKTLRADPHGLDLGPLMPRLPGALRTKRRRIDLAPRLMIDELARVARALDDEKAAPVPATRPLVLVGRRDLRSNNSWMHNVPVLVRGLRRCTLLMHPQDAAARGLTDGGTARVTSRVGTVDVTVELTDAMMPGVVSLPHGWGHDVIGAQQAVARRHPGVSANALTDDLRLDSVTGTAAFNGVPVTVAIVPP